MTQQPIHPNAVEAHEAEIAEAARGWHQAAGIRVTERPAGLAVVIGDRPRQVFDLVEIDGGKWQIIERADVLVDHPERRTFASQADAQAYVAQHRERCEIGAIKPLPKARFGSGLGLRWGRG